jgi:hypothetical protein
MQVIQRAAANINELLATKAYRACSQRGADMGRPNHFGTPTKLYLQHVRFGVNDPYDAGGAYWGFPANLWCAHNVRAKSQLTLTEPRPGEVNAGGIDDVTMVFVRANSRTLAKQAVLACIELSWADKHGWSFYR